MVRRSYSNSLYPTCLFFKQIPPKRRLKGMSVEKPFHCVYCIKEMLLHISLLYK